MLSEGGGGLPLVRRSRCTLISTVHVYLCLHRAVKWCVHREDAGPCHARIQLWMAVHVECVMDAALTDEAVSTESDSHTRPTTASCAPVWYYRIL